MAKTTYSKKAVVALCAVVYFTSYFSRKSFAATLFGMLQAGVLSETTAGLVETAMFIFYGAGQLLSGFLGDRVKPAVLLGAGLGTTALCNLALPLMPSGEWIIPVWALNGLAQAMLWPPIVRILATNLDHERYVTANLVVTTAAHAATVLLYLYVPLCLTYMTWRAAFYSAGALAVAVFIVFLFAISRVLPSEHTLPSATAQASSKPSVATPHKIGAILIRSGILPIFGAIIMCGILRDGIETWLPTLYGQAFDRDAGESVLVSVVLPIFAVATVTVVTVLHRRRFFNNEARGSATLFLFAAVLCVPLSFLMEAEAPLARYVCLTLAALVCASMHGINFLLISCLPGRFAHFGRSS
ncbi:MAG: MFS transporter, partial [Ruminococcaceae bacterium]|nr:MFS transporter [Oscillospiraceae bacterium]